MAKPLGAEGRERSSKEEFHCRRSRFIGPANQGRNRMQIWSDQLARALRLCMAAGVAVALGVGNISPAAAADPTPEEQAKDLLPPFRRQPGSITTATGTPPTSSPIPSRTGRARTPRPGRSATTIPISAIPGAPISSRSFKALTTQLADQGLAKPDLIVTNSNGDINLELTAAQGAGRAGVRPDHELSGLGDRPLLRHQGSLRQGRPVRDHRFDRSPAPKRSTSRPIPITAASSAATGSPKDRRARAMSS